MENTTESTSQDEMKAKKAADFKAEKLRIIGITEERLGELQEIVLDGVDEMRNKGKEIDRFNLIDTFAGKVTDNREAMFIGSILGAALAEMNNPLTALMGMISRQKD